MAAPRHPPWITAALAVALSLVGCGLIAPPGEPVPLLTGDGPNGGGCFTAEYRFTLEPDAHYGTRTGEDGVPGDETIPVMWPTGYTGRRLSSGEVVVRDRSGNVVATTGHTYEVGGGSLDYENTRAWFACSYVIEAAQ